MKITVTGGLGTMGAPLVTLLRERGHDVWVIDQGSQNGQTLRADVGEFRQLEAAVLRANPDLVYHLAAEFGRFNGEDFYESMWRANAVGTKHVLRLQRLMGFKLVHASSSEVYGDFAGVMNEHVPERMPLQQLNDYAISKWVNELQIANEGGPTVIIRPFNTYGPGEWFSEYRSVICQFVYRALHDQPYTVFEGHARTSTYIDDAVRTVANIADRFKPGEVYNIAAGKEAYRDIRSISDMVLAECGKDDSLVTYKPVEHGNTRYKRTSNQKSVDDLDHVDSVTLEEGIARTVAWQREVYGR